MEKFKRKFTRIHDGYSENRRIPILGKIRLGLKVKNPKGVEYPKEVDYFVCPDEVRAVYGDYPKELDVLLAHDDPEMIFPQQLIMWGQSRGIKCQGNRQEAERLNEQTGKFEPRSCPCEFLKTDDNTKGTCTQVSNLLVMIPTVSLGGNYQVSTGSYHSTVELNSSLDWVRSVVGRIKNVPLKLKRVPKETHHGGKKQTHYLVTLTLNATVAELNALQANTQHILEKPEYQLEAPKLEPPANEPPDVFEAEAETVASEQDEGEQRQVDVLAPIRDQVDILGKSGHGARQLRAINKRFRVKDFTELRPDQRVDYFDQVSTEAEALEKAEHAYA